MWSTSKGYGKAATEQALYENLGFEAGGRAVGGETVYKLID